MNFRIKHFMLAKLTAGLLLGFILVSVTSHAAAIGDERSKLSRQLIDKGAKLSFNKRSGKTRFIGTHHNQAITVPDTSPALSIDQNAKTILRSYGPMFGIKNADQQLRLMKKKTRSNGRSMVRFQQMHNGIPVLGGELIVNMDAQQRLVSMNGETSDNKGVTTTPSVDPSNASATALAAIAKVHNINIDQLQASPPELTIYDPSLISAKTTPARLVWHVQVSAISITRAIRELVLIDALTGQLALHFNQVHAAKNRETYDLGGHDVPPVYDDPPLSQLPGRLICTEANGDACSNGANPEADAAHQFAGDTYDFYAMHHGRDGIDDRGGTIISTVNYCPDEINCPMTNAFWYDGYMIYGRGFIVDDVVAHELTHGVTDSTSKLFYYYQSGAINESFSDIWGEFMDQTNAGPDVPADNWYMGEDMDPTIVYPPGSEIYGGAIRSMADPTLFGDPDHMTSPNYHRTIDDEGGVHVNSGINNKAVYLMAELSSKDFATPSTSFSGPGIGIEKVAKIYYEVQTTLLTSGSDYADLYAAVIQACDNLTGSDGITVDDCVIVKNALDAVEMNLDPNGSDPMPFIPDAPLCDAGSPTEPGFIFHEDFESGYERWSFRNLLGSTIYWYDMFDVYGIPYATSGIHSLAGGADGVTTNHATEVMVTVPMRSPYLHFKHVYDFEFFGSEYFDGGVLEYSANDGINWNDIISLSSVIITGQNYNGVISPFNENPLAGQMAFTGVSHGFVSTRYDLSSIAGQRVRFRWRIGTDISIESNGWVLDDVSVYSCDNTPPTAPVLISPADNAKFTSNSNIDFQWEDGVDTIDQDTVTHTVLVCRGANCLPVTPYAQFTGFLNHSPALAGLGFGGILLMLFASTGRRRQLYLLVCLTATLLLSSSCGRGSSSHSISGPTTTYRWRVEANDGNSVTYSDIRTYTVVSN